MIDHNLEYYEQIDWEKLRSQSLRRKGWQTKKPSDWDNKASSFSSRNKSSAYVDQFLENLPLNNSLTVLDIGSGPGTLALPIASRVKHVTAMDFSGGMLELLRDSAEEEGLRNISTVQCAWEDDWRQQGINNHDLVIASRSMGVENLTRAIQKLNDFANQFVFITDRIGSTPFDAGAFSAIGRPFEAGPDYIYTLNILYTLDIHPNIRIIQLDTETTYRNIDDALRSYMWMFKELSNREEKALVDYLHKKTVASRNGSITIRKDFPPKWALIWWQKETD